MPGLQRTMPIAGWLLELVGRFKESMTNESLQNLYVDAPIPAGCL